MKAIVWSKPMCPFCDKAKNLLKTKGIEYEERNIAQGWKIQDLLEAAPSAKTMPDRGMFSVVVSKIRELNSGNLENCLKAAARENSFNCTVAYGLSFSSMLLFRFVRYCVA